jgi:hypothetical protein
MALSSNRKENSEEASELGFRKVVGGLHRGGLHGTDTLTRQFYRWPKVATPSQR